MPDGQDLSVNSFQVGADGTIYVGTPNHILAYKGTNPPDPEAPWPMVGYNARNTRAAGSGQNQNTQTLPKAFGDYFTGKLKWKLPGFGLPSTIGPDGTLYFRTDRIRAVDPDTRQIKWESVPLEKGSSASLADGKLFLASTESSKKIAIDTTTGKVLWEKNIGGSSVGIPAVGVTDTSTLVQEGSYYAINSENGEEIWRFKTDEQDGQATPTIGNEGTIYCGTYDSQNKGKLYALDGTTGQLLWKYVKTAGIASVPAVDTDETVYFGSWDQKIYAIDGKTGERKWRLSTNKSVNGFPVIGKDGTLLLPTDTTICD